MKGVMRTILVFMLAAGLFGCGANDGFVGTTASQGVTDTSVGSITLLTSNPQLGTSSTASITLTAIVKDLSNRALEGTTVDFSATSGSLVVASSTTDQNGTVTATLSPGSDPSNRTITVTATAGTLSSSYNVTVTGSQVSISGTQNVVFGDTIDLTVALKDSAGVPIANQALTVSSASGNTLVPVGGSYQTAANGQLVVQLTATATGTDTITATALGTTATYGLTVSADTFDVSAPTEINIGSCASVAATWSSGGTPKAAETINFSATRGNIYSDAGCITPATSAVTNASGIATVYITAANSGPSVITADAVTGPSASTQTEFVATTPASITFQAAKTTIAPNESVALTAVVRDANNNLVKNTALTFRIVSDPTSGNINPGTGTTDSLGRASITYTATDQASSKDGIVIEAKVDGTAFTDTVKLTVAQTGLFITVGLASVVTDETPASYAYPGVVLITDSAGNPVSGVSVVLSIIPTYYNKGDRQWTGTTPGIWAINTAIVNAEPGAYPGRDGLNLPCVNEDTLTGLANYDLNGNLDPGEDYDGSGQLETGNVASVDTSVTTNDNGYAEFNIRYPKDYATWTQVRLLATASVSGTESSRAVDFVLPVATSDVNSETKAPPGNPSPYGTAPTSGNCADPD